MINQIKQEKLLAILRLSEVDDVIEIVKAIHAGGIHCIEITANTPHALQHIQNLTKLCLPRLCLGVGSIISLDQVEVYAEAGAQYIVTPNLNPLIIEKADALGLPTICGTMTPTEMMAAHQLGCEIIKVFPSLNGPEYIQTVLAPMPFLNLLPTGGITLENIDQWFDAGSCVVGLGSALLKGFEGKDFKVITKNAELFIKKTIH